MSPATARGARTRAALLAAAREVFERDGFGDARVAEITRIAGCATGSFYTYFASKEEILSVVLYEAQKDVLHPHIPPEDGITDPAELVEANHRAFFETYRANARLMLFMEQVASHDANFRGMRRRQGWAYAERSAVLVRRLQALGLADPELDPVLAMRSLATMVTRMAYNTFVAGDETSLDDLVAISTRLWLNAIGVTARTEAVAASAPAASETSS
ncbi:TetR/AcrR family transcriptional regulator [Mumia sp. zg.B21]|uniref:TetR/AcrR family transcriptional regulator n=1 Tax=Mumia sp. zg.B21 TaxID=2855447 RepID=UPI001C6E901E|nr:TetR/AcrR family transcriptional regulator [Mumia sp. zg.B21]MBW9210969.1 TetR/AcrR family transcriptional regulator [Mumia sp. zg.B21]